MRGAGSGLNVRAAVLHVLADLVSSVGVVVAGAVVLATGWPTPTRSPASLIGLLVLASPLASCASRSASCSRARRQGWTRAAIGMAMASTDGVVDVHDLHVWTITSGFPALSAHVLVRPDADCHAIRRELEALLRERFELTHTTLQVEHAPGLVQVSR